MKTWVFVFVFLTIETCLAASGSAHHTVDEIPAGFYWTSVNFVLFFGLVYFLGRKKIAGFFSGRAQNYSDLVERASKARQQAEAAKQEISSRLNELESGLEASVKRAKEEVESIKTKLQQEARTIAENIEADTKRTVQVELESAKVALRNELLDQALGVSKELLTDKMAEQDQQRLQTEFLQKIEVVQS